MAADDELDDAAVRAMRTVWLSMRDEEPSSRGMAELMAAARAQVAVPPWRRALAALADMLRRPPVLALATVVLVAGTAVLVTSHGGLDVEQAKVATTPFAQSTQPAPPVPATGAAPSGDRGGDLDGKNASASLEPARAPEAPSVPAAPVAAPTPAPAPAMHTSRMAAGPSAPPPKAAVTSLAAVAKPESKSRSIAPSAGKRPSAPAADDAEEASAIAQEMDSPAHVDARTPSPAPAAAPPPPPPPPSNDQLLRECEAAAARGDCAAVRAMVERLRAQDPAFFRTTVARDSALATCLAAPAPASRDRQ